MHVPNCRGGGKRKWEARGRREDWIFWDGFWYAGFRKIYLPEIIQTGALKHQLHLNSTPLATKLLDKPISATFFLPLNFIIQALLCLNLATFSMTFCGFSSLWRVSLTVGQLQSQQSTLWLGIGQFGKYVNQHFCIKHAFLLITYNILIF